MTEYCGRGIGHCLAQLAVLLEDRRKDSAAEVSKVIAEATSQAVGEALEEFVAAVAAVCVVDVAQVLDVEKDDGRAILFDSIPQQIVEMFAEQFAVRESCQ